MSSKEQSEIARLVQDVAKDGKLTRAEKQRLDALILADGQLSFLGFDVLFRGHILDSK